jgi:hypothetical protein
MFQEKTHVVAGPEIKTLEDLNGTKVNFSDLGSGTQIRARDVFRLLSTAVVEVYLSQADAVAKVKTGEIAGIVVFSGKSVGVLSRVSGSDNVHLLEVPYTRTLENNDVPARLESPFDSNLIANTQAVQTNAVDPVLITNDWLPTSESYQRFVKFEDSFFRDLPRSERRRGTRNGKRSPSARRCLASGAFPSRRAGSTAQSNRKPRAGTTKVTSFCPRIGVEAIRLGRKWRNSDASSSPSSGLRVK